MWRESWKEKEFLKELVRHKLSLQEVWSRYFVWMHSLIIWHGVKRLCTSKIKGRNFSSKINGTIKFCKNLTVCFHQFQEWKPRFHSGNNNLVQTKLLPISHQTYIYDLHEQPEFATYFMVSLELQFHLMCSTN